MLLRGESVVLTERALGEGRVVVVADNRLFTNAALTVDEDASFILGVLYRSAIAPNRDVEICDAWIAPAGRSARRSVRARATRAWSCRTGECFRPSARVPATRILPTVASRSRSAEAPERIGVPLVRRQDRARRPGDLGDDGVCFDARGLGDRRALSTRSSRMRKAIAANGTPATTPSRRATRRACARRFNRRSHPVVTSPRSPRSSSSAARMTAAGGELRRRCGAA